MAANTPTHIVQGNVFGALGFPASEASALKIKDEAALVVGAGGAEAGLAAGVEAAPERAGLGQAGDFGAVAGFAGLLPLRDLMKLIDLFEAGQNWTGIQDGQLVAAEGVGAALHVADPEVAEQRFEKGDVAEGELVLQSLGARGDDDAAAGSQRGD